MVKRRQPSERQNGIFFLDEAFDSHEDYIKRVLDDAEDLDSDRVERVLASDHPRPPGPKTEDWKATCYRLREEERKRRAGSCRTGSGARTAGTEE